MFDNALECSTTPADRCPRHDHDDPELAEHESMNKRNGLYVHAA